MIDGSHEPFEENVAVTKRVVNRAHKKGISVEAELGRLGGVEAKLEEPAITSRQVELPAENGLSGRR